LSVKKMVAVNVRCLCVPISVSSVFSVSVIARTSFIRCARSVKAK